MGAVLRRDGAAMSDDRMSYPYVVETMGGNVWYAVRYFPYRMGRRRMRVTRCVGYREPS